VTDENDYLETIVEELRANEGLKFRRLLSRLREDPHPDAALLVEKLKTHPELRDLVPH
jgi:hypothetical protein